MKDTSQTIPFNTNNTIACKRFMEAKIDGILIIMCRKIRLILVCLIAISSLQSQAQALYGTTGLLHAPTAEMQKDKTFMVGGNVLHLVPLQYFNSNEVKYTFNYYLNVTIFPWLEVGYTCTINHADHGSTYFPPQSWGKYTNQDRAFNARLRLWKEGWWKSWTPQIVLGLDDPTSHESYGGGAIKFDEDGMQNNHFTRYYLAATKHFSFAGVGTLGVHAAYVDYRACWFPHYRRPAAGVNFKFNLLPENNLVVKAYKLLDELFDLPPVDIHLFKHIPSGAGLGGGSADAAFMLKLLNEKFNLALSIESMEDYASRLGADCAFFIRNAPTYAEGIGNVFSPVSLSLKGYQLWLVKPDIFVSTRDAFSQIKPHRPERPLKETIQLPVEEWRNCMVNDFEESVFPQFPAIREIKEEMYRQGAVYASMSGSGSSVYGIFKPNASLPDIDFGKEAFVYKGKLAV